MVFSVKVVKPLFSSGVVIILPVTLCTVPSYFKAGFIKNWLFKMKEKAVSNAYTLTKGRTIYFFRLRGFIKYKTKADTARAITIKAASFENKIKNMLTMAIVMPAISIGRFILIITFQILNQPAGQISFLPAIRWK